MRLHSGVVSLCMVCLLVGGAATAQQKEESPAVKVDSAQLRLKVRNNVLPIFRKLEQPERIEQAAEKYFETDSWNKALASFQGHRSSEIHDAAHGVIKSMLPDIMQKFMPKYMQAKIMAERQAKKAKGPPSPAEIDKIRAETMAKMKPAMQNTAMSALKKLTDERIDEALKDEKVLTRVLAEQLLKGIILPEPVVAKFKAELDKAGYPESLIRGADPVLNERVRKMLQSIDIAAVAKEAGL